LTHKLGKAIGFSLQGEQIQVAGFFSFVQASRNFSGWPFFMAVYLVQTAMPLRSTMMNETDC
jgi:hypothetical protein